MNQLPLLAYIIIFTTIGSVLSLLGGVFLLWKKGLTRKVSHLLVSFAAGTLLATAFFDLMPEGINQSSVEIIFLFTLGGFLSFFIIERLIHWMHHHHADHNEEHSKPTVALIMVGDSIHNFIDGVAIAATFLVSIPLGIITAIAVGTHEIPQEIGDFAVMLRRGIKPKKVLLFNFFSALTALVGAIFMFVLGDKLENYLPIFLALTAGFFIYISASDLIPEIHEKNRKSFALFETLCLILGIVVVWLLVKLLEG